jgi:hypothetical protein
MRRHRRPPLVAVTTTLLLLVAACATELDPGSDVDRLVDDDGGAAHHAVTPGPGEVRVVDARGGAVVGARVAVRDRLGRPRRTTVTGAGGSVAGLAADEVVVASAPGHQVAARVGPGLLRLVARDAFTDAVERAVVRRRASDQAVVVEVIAGDDGAPRTAGLIAARAGDVAPASRFRDVTGHPLALHVEALASRGIVAGDPDGRFRPDAPLTRAELAALLLRALGLPPADSAPFHDVDDGAWYLADVGGVARAGLMRGDPDGAFRPADAVSRAEVAATLRMLLDLNAADVDAARASVHLTDVRGHWAADALVATLGWCGLLDVDTEGRVAPDAPATRAVAVAALSRALGCALDRAPTRGRLLGTAAAAQAWTTQRTHLTLLRERGLGTHYGDASPYHRLPVGEQQAFLDARLRPGAARVDVADLTRSSCVEYVMEQTARGFAAVDAGDEWQRVEATARAEQLRGTSLARALVAEGWRAFLVVATTDRNLIGDDGEHAYSLAVARRDRVSYGVPLEGALVGFIEHERVRAAMDALPFGVLVQRGGLHVVAVADGTVHELARGEGPHQEVIYADPWRDIVRVYAEDIYGGGENGLRRALHMWGSGILVVPPGTAPDAVEWF